MRKFGTLGKGMGSLFREFAIEADSTLLLLVYVVYIGIRCYVKGWLEERGYY